MKVQYFTGCTLDGFIADENNSLDWLFEAPHSPEHTFWEDWFPGIGGMVWGATTYEGHLERNGPGSDSWREYFGERPCWIFTHRELPLVPGIPMKLVEGDVKPVHEDAMATVGERDLWLVGGGELVGQFYDARLLDEIILEQAPVTLGAGAPLLPRRITSKNLSFREAELIGQRLQIVLDVNY